MPWLSLPTTWQTQNCDLPILSNRILQAFSMNYALESNIPTCLLYFCHWHRTKFWFFAGVECTIISKGQNVLQTFQLLNTAGSCLQTTSLRNRWINYKEQTSDQREHLSTSMQHRTKCCDILTQEGSIQQYPTVILLDQQAFSLINPTPVVPSSRAPLPRSSPVDKQAPGMGSPSKAMYGTGLQLHLQLTTFICTF